jgi:hypothetical protein
VLHATLVQRLEAFGCTLLERDEAGDFWDAPPGSLPFRIPDPDSTGEVDDDVLHIALVNQWCSAEMIRFVLGR